MDIFFVHDEASFFPSIFVPINPYVPFPQTDIIRPREYACSKGIINKQRQPFSVRRKEFWLADRELTEKLLQPKFLQQLSHEPDGLIFQPDPMVKKKCLLLDKNRIEGTLHSYMKLITYLKLKIDIKVLFHLRCFFQPNPMVR